MRKNTAKQNNKMSKTNNNVEITVQNAEGEPDTKATILVQNQIDYEPKVSVIIPVYNVEEYLRQCLDSVINQTLKEIEIICVDDGSTDSSLEILKEYAAKDHRITLITQQNKGAAIARNNAIRIAKGIYLAFCDSDDWIDYNFYEYLYKSSDNASIDVIKGNTAKAFGTNIKKDSNLNNYILESSKNHIVSTFQYEWWSAIYKNSLIKENEIYFKTALLAEDQEFLCHVLCCSKSYKIINDVYYYYYQNPSSLTHKITTNHILDLVNMDYSILEHLKKYNIPTLDQYLVIKARIIYLIQYWNFCNKNNLGTFFLQNTYKLIEYLNKLDVNNNQFKKINNISKLKKYISNTYNHKDTTNTTHIMKFKLFNFIPILSIEYKVNKSMSFCNSNQHMDIKSEFNYFLYHNIKPNSILMIEFNDFHGECLSGMVKYFLDLGYNIDVCISPSETALKPFSKFISDKINIFTMDKQTIKHLLCQDIVEKYTYLYINSDMIYEKGFIPVFQYIGSEIKFPEEKIITMCHHADKYSYIEPKNDRFSVVALNKLPILENKNYYMVNTHFFNSFIRTNKNEKINFICVGNIESKRKNHSLLFDAIDKLLQQKITNFKVTIIARAGNLDIPKHIKPYLDFKGKLSYTDMYNELEKADFYLPLFDPENKLHERYLSSGSSGSYQLIYGFTLPCIISRKFQTNVNGFNDNNSIGYDQNKDLSKAMKIAIEMSNSEYLEKVQQIKILADSIYNESLENLKKILKPKEAKYPNNFFISLGEHCFSRTVLTRHYLKQRKNQGELSCPFDLCVCPFSSTYNLIKNDFANYFDALEYDDNDELWVNKQYGIRYNHDKDCSKENKDKLIQRYTQRIENFRFLLKDTQQHVFVFSSVKTDINIKDLCNLYKLLSDKCNYDIKLFFINIGKDELKNINLLTNYKNIYYAHIPNPYPNYWGEWYKYEYFNSQEGQNFENNIINFIETNTEYAKIQFYDLIIPLGQNCACAEILKKAKLRKYSMPFDWASLENTETDLTGGLETNCNLFLSNCKNILNINDLIEIPEKCNSLNNRYIVNKYTGLRYIHDFPLNISIKEAYKNVFDKYTRRINRMYTIIDKFKHICFLFDNVGCYPLDIKNFQKHVNLLVPKFIEKYKNKKINFLIFLHKNDIPLNKIEIVCFSPNITYVYLNNTYTHENKDSSLLGNSDIIINYLINTISLTCRD